MKKAVIKAVVDYVSKWNVKLEFGRVQGSMELSGVGTIQRKLGLRTGDKVKIVLEKSG